MLGRRYQVSAGVFWQVHPGAPPVLARTVLDGLDPQVGERVADLYAGAGLFTALLADAVGPTGAVVAIERSGRACADAARNTDGQPQVTMTRSDVTAELVASAGLGRPDLVVLDPAREGAGRAGDGGIGRVVGRLRGGLPTSPVTRRRSPGTSG